VGEPWPGVLDAERRLEAESGAAGITASEARREKTRTYDRWLAEQAADAEAAGKSSAESFEPRRGTSGG
jgi:hypothetical protein